MRHWFEDRFAALVQNDATPDQRRLSTDSVESILPLRDLRGSVDLGGDHEMHRPVPVGKPEQLFKCA
jgi:hypothetical protein